MSDTATLTFATYNILAPELAVKWKVPAGLAANGQDNWPVREGQLHANIRALVADITCLQEISADSIPALQRDFAVAGAALFPHPQGVVYYGTGLLYNPQQLELAETFTLISSHDGERSASGAVFVHKPSRRKVAALSVHLAGYDNRERDADVIRTTCERGRAELASYITQLEPYAARADLTLLAGDFNEDTAVPVPSALCRINILQQAGYAWDGSQLATEPASGRVIDYLALRGGQPKPAPVALPFPQASDHLPVRARLVF